MAQFALPDFQGQAENPQAKACGSLQKIHIFNRINRDG
jgi:hypothetical protein